MINQQGDAPGRWNGGFLRLANSDIFGINQLFLVVGLARMGVGCRAEQAVLGDSVQSERLGLCYLVIQAQS